MPDSHSKRGDETSVDSYLHFHTVKNVFAVIATIVISSTLPPVVEAQNYFTEASQILSVNNMFEADLSGWNKGKMTVDRLMRDWVVSFGTNFIGAGY